MTLNLVIPESKEERYRKAKQDFLALVNTLGPLYDGLTDQQRATQIANFAIYNTLTDAQKDNALGFGLALLAVGLDFLARAD